MTTIYTYSEARQNFASLLDLAIREGEVRIQRRDGQRFVLRPEQLSKSPLEVEGIDLNINVDEIIESIQEGRRGYST